MKKKLTRDTRNAAIGGVVAGLANYFDHDITFWRLAVVVALIVTGVFPLGLFYLAAWWIMPEDDGVSYTVVE